MELNRTESGRRKEDILLAAAVFKFNWEDDRKDYSVQYDILKPALPLYMHGVYQT